VSFEEAQLATCELGHLHWAGHCPLTPTTTLSNNKNTTLKYNILLCYVANALCLERFPVATAFAEVSVEVPVLLDCCLGRLCKYILLLICLLLYQLPILFECGHDKSISAHSTNSFILIITGDKRNKSAIKYLCGYKSSNIHNKMSASFSFKTSCFLATEQCTPSCSLQNSQRHSLHLMKLTCGQLRYCIVADHMIRSTGM